MTRQEAIDDIRDNILPVVGGQSLQMAIKALEEPEVIRCKDCKFWNFHIKECVGIGKWFGEEDAWSDFGFCYKAERREG